MSPLVCGAASLMQEPHVSASAPPGDPSTVEDQEPGLCPGRFLSQYLHLSRNCFDLDPVHRLLPCLPWTLLVGRELGVTGTGRAH